MNENVPKSSKKFICEKCDYNTSRKSQYDRHVLTPKHQNVTNVTNNVTKKVPILHECDCGKNYNSRVGLWRHKKTCNVSKSNTKESNVIVSDSVSMSVSEKELLYKMVESNEVKNEIIKNKDDMIIELQKQLIDALNKPTTVNNTQNNNQFNLQMYLNETCSNAINIDTLLKNIKVTIENVIEIGEIGYSKGIGNLIAKHIKGMNQIEKPIQTTDMKRGLSWIKNKNNEWIKDEDLTLANNFIFLVGDKYFREYANGITSITEWKDTQSKIHDKVIESINQITKVIISDDKTKDYSKIHKAIAENTMVKK
jgi:hypothetical protein